MLLLEPPLHIAWLAGFYAALGAAVPDLDLRKRHRKLLHNVLALTLTTIAVSLASSMLFGAYAAYFAAFYATGYVFHLFVDLFTRRGVALLWPFSNRMFRVCRLRSESLAANAFFSILGAAALVLWFLLSARNWSLASALANTYKAPTI